MKAIQVRLPATLESLVLVDMPDPGSPGAGEIRVRIRASSLNYHDYAVVTGAIAAADKRVPMSDGAGDVVAIGEGVTDFAVGDAVVSTFFPNWNDGERRGLGFDRVPGDGLDGYAREEVVCPTFYFTHVPKSYSHAEAATLTCAGVTAWRALVVNGGLKAGDTVLVQGTGGVSIFALQIAKAMGATVVATSSSDEKLSRLKALGADHLVNYRTHEKWGKAVRGDERRRRRSCCRDWRIRYARPVHGRRACRWPYRDDRHSERISQPRHDGDADAKGTTRTGVDGWQPAPSARPDRRHKRDRHSPRHRPRFSAC
jgi:NADPH:quinone reductase-like Zn-dependent oxidoreductase